MAIVDRLPPAKAALRRTFVLTLLTPSSNGVGGGGGGSGSGGGGGRGAGAGALPPITLSFVLIHHNHVCKCEAHLQRKPY